MKIGGRAMADRDVVGNGPIGQDRCCQYGRGADRSTAEVSKHKCNLSLAGDQQQVRRLCEGDAAELRLPDGVKNVSGIQGASFKAIA